ncbi:MAG: hypothetical protein ACOYIF_03800 [Acetivibrionales bacterium]
MEEAIKRIIEIEHEAQNLVNQGRVQSDSIRMNTLEAQKNMEADIIEMSKSKIEQIRTKSRMETDEKIRKIKESTERKINILEDYVGNNREIWEKQIFTRILGR